MIINVEELYKRISEYDNVSFDIFDTLIKRNVYSPTDVFALIEQKTCKSFKDKRINAEHMARAEKRSVEITLEDIYSFFSEAEREIFLDAEKEMENNVSVSNIIMIDIYNRCIKDSKNVYLVSDMYLPKETIECLLKKCNITGYKKLYLSSEGGYKKSTGELYKKILEEENIRPFDLIHIGDNLSGDWLQPKKLGIDVVKIPKMIEHRFSPICDTGDSIELNYLNSFVNNHYPCFNNLYYQFGYSYYGKALYGFANWIHEEAAKKGITKLFFLSRDGFMAKKAYETCIDDNNIEIHYLQVSRRSLRVPILWMDCSYESVMPLIVNSMTVSLEEIVNEWGLEIDDYTSILKKYNLKRADVFEKRTILNNKKLQMLFNDMRSDIISNSKSEYEIIIKYLKMNNVEGEFGIVDIGYAGSMQKYLDVLLSKIGITHSIVGLYLAVTNDYKKNEIDGSDLDVRGYILDNKRFPRMKDVRGAYVGLLETLFLEERGSVKKYTEYGKNVQVIRYPFVYESLNSTDELKKDRMIKKGALEFLTIAASDELLKELKCKPKEYFSDLNRMGHSPTLFEAKLLGDLIYEDESGIRSLASPKSLVYYLEHLNELKQDFLVCRWKTAFLRRLFKIKLPYNIMLTFLRRIS